MPIIKITITKYKCSRCEHEWGRRSKDSTDEPVVCPKCKSPYWDKPKREPIEKDT